MSCGEKLKKEAEYLHGLFKRHGTDKAHHRYAVPYTRFLANLREDPITFMEIGVKNGKSLASWKEYFPMATIIGIDIDAQCKSFESDRVKVCIGDQSDKEFLAQVSKDHGPFDVIIDDGSHESFDQQLSLGCLWDSLNPSGIYIIEDLSCCRWVNFNKKQCKRQTYEHVQNMIKNTVIGRQARNTKEIYLYCNVAIIVKPNDWKW